MTAGTSEVEIGIVVLMASEEQKEQVDTNHDLKKIDCLLRVAAEFHMNKDAKCSITQVIYLTEVHLETG